jgi:hypothetical protein
MDNHTPTILVSEGRTQTEKRIMAALMEEALKALKRNQKPREQLYLVEWDDGSTDIMLLPESKKVGDRVWLEWARAYVTVLQRQWRPWIAS